LDRLAPAGLFSRFQAGEQLLEESGHRPLVILRQRCEQALLPGGVGGNRLLEHFPAGGGQFDQDTAAVAWMRCALDVTTALEAVEPAGDTRRGEHQTFEQLGGRKPLT